MKLTFDDVLIVPKFSDISSRSEVSLESSIGKKLQVNLPVISSNMDTVTGPEMAKYLLNRGATACLPRFGTIEDSIKLFKESDLFKDHKPMVSIGLGQCELDRAEALYSLGASNFVIDVAHGAQTNVVNQAKSLRSRFGEEIGIIVGNFASAESVKTFLEHAGDGIVDAIKVGIGPGSACTTRIKTGVGYPQLAAIADISNILKNTGIAVIADGGMKTPADIAKAIGAGANLVMLGGMLSGTHETPGDIYADYLGKKVKVLRIEGETVLLDIAHLTLVYKKDTNLYKRYRGSASLESYQVQGKEAKHRTAEGEAFYVSYKGSVVDVIQDIEGGLRSAMTYVGARTIKEFQSKVEFVQISPSTVNENGAHGKK